MPGAHGVSDGLSVRRLSAPTGFLKLRPHDATPPTDVEGAYAAVRRTGRYLLLRYEARGDLAKIMLPTRYGGFRRDGLWRKTCFELFLRRPGATEYFEFNFSPSGDWSAYSFSSYRKGRRNPHIERPSIRVQRTDSALALDVRLEIPVRARPYEIGLSAVLAHPNGPKSYWALAHTPGRPDFHHPSAFALSL